MNTVMGEVISVLFLLLCISTYVECRYCVHITDNGAPYSFTCASYEFCCGYSCCRSSAFKFYQFWYFWLSVILILLMCSGGSWWYRLRYRNQFFTPHYPTNIYGTDHQHRLGVMYYATVDRVSLPQPPKDFTGQVVAPPSYAQASAENAPYSHPPSQPAYYNAGLPPPYETIVADQQGQAANFTSQPPTQNSNLNLGFRNDQSEPVNNSTASAPERHLY